MGFKKFLGIMIVFLLFMLTGVKATFAANLNEDFIKINDFSHYKQQNYNYNGNGYFFVRKIESSQSFRYTTGFYLAGNSGTLTYYDDNKKLISLPLRDGLLPKDRILFLSTDKHQLILGQGYTYKSLGNGTVDSLSSLPISVKNVGGRYLINYSYDLTSSDFGILWGLGSDQSLVDLSDPTVNMTWRNYDVDKNARILYEGYHYKSPSNYLPSTNNSYWNIPSSYIANSLIKNGGSLASDLWGNGLLHIESKNINQEGFLPTLPRSQWLYNDYNIPAGFFDTRFNADTIETNIIAWRKFQEPLYRENYLRLANYYINHVDKNHYTLFDSKSVEGWLVDDYYYPGSEPTLVALNHQLQAIHVFYMLYESEKDIKYLNIADKMLNGIKATRDMWIMADGNLIYAYMPDGSMGLPDYPYLTYNDLMDVQNDLLRIKGMNDPDIEVLINTKKSWMDREGVER